MVEHIDPTSESWSTAWITAYVTQWCCAPSDCSDESLAGLFGWWPYSLMVGTRWQMDREDWTSSLDLEKHVLYIYISNLYVTFKETVVVGWWKRYHKTWCCGWQVWPVHSLTITIGTPSGPYDLTIILVLEEDALNRDGEIITEIRRASIKEGMK